MPDDQTPKPDPVSDALQDALKAADESIDEAVTPADTQIAIQVRQCVQAKIDAYNEQSVSDDNIALHGSATDIKHGIDQLNALKADIARIDTGFAIAGKVVGVLDSAVSALGV